MTEPTVALGYIRVSTDEQVRGGISLEAQESRIRAYCELKGMTLSKVIRDEGVSASTPIEERPSGRDLVAALSSRKAQSVVAIKLDRLFRDAVDCLTKVGQWDDSGIAMHVIDLGGNSIDTKSAAGRFMLTVMAGAAEMERNLIIERTKAALTLKRARREKLGGIIPYGWSVQKGRLVARPQEQPVLREILSKRSAGLGYRAIAALLNERGLKPRMGKRWYGTTVRSICLRALREKEAIEAHRLAGSVHDRAIEDE